MSDKKSTPYDRMTDPGIFIAGDEVIWDGEAEALGVPPKKRAPRYKPPVEKDDE